MRNSLLTDAAELLRTSEEVLTNTSHLRKHRKFLSGFTCVDVVGVGMVGSIGPAVRFLIYWGLASLFVALISKITNLQPETLSAFYFFAAILPFVFVGFALPSSYVSDGISDVRVSLVIEQMGKDASFSEHQLDALQKTVEEFHARALARINSFQWMIASVWAFAIFLYSQYSGLLWRLLPASDVPQQLFNAGGALIGLAFASLFLIYAVFGYKRSVDKIFRLSQMALREMRLVAKEKS